MNKHMNSRRVSFWRCAFGIIAFGLTFFVLLGGKSVAKDKSPYDPKDFTYTVTVENSDEETITLDVAIENRGTDFEGVFRMFFLENGYRYYIVYYDTDLTLPTGGAKSFKVTVPSTAVWPDNISSVEYQLVDYKGNSVELGEDTSLLQYASSPRRIGGSSFLEDVETYANQLNAHTHPLHGGRVIVLVLVFVALSGPLGYLILAKTKKREFYWIMVPALSLLFAVFIFIAGGTYRLSGANMLSVRVVDGAGLHNDQVSFMAYNAQAQDFTIDFNESVFAVGGQSEDYVYSFQDNNESGAVSFVNNGRKLYMSAKPTETFECYFGSAMAWKTGTPGCFTVNGVYVDRRGEVQGTLTNNTGKDLDAVFVAVEDEVYVLNGVKAGETVKLADLQDGQNYYHSYSRFYSWWQDDVKYASACSLADLFVADSDSNVTAVYGICLGGDGISGEKVKESTFTVYYAVE